MDLPAGTGQDIFILKEKGAKAKFDESEEMESEGVQTGNHVAIVRAELPRNIDAKMISLIE